MLKRLSPEFLSAYKLLDELIGKKVEVVRSHDRNIIGLSGIIILEDKESFLIRTRRGNKRVYKRGTEFYFPELSLRVIGDVLYIDPARRTKYLVLRRWRSSSCEESVLSLAQIQRAMYRYSFPEEKFDKERMVRAAGRNLNISPKHAVEIMNAIRGMRLNDAIKLLEDVVALKRPIPFKRFKRNVGHRRELNGRKSGRYPQKAAKHILRVLENLKANAEDRGLDPDRIRIIHAVAHRASMRYKRVPRAFGVSAPERVQFVHVEVIGEEVR